MSGPGCANLLESDDDQDQLTNLLLLGGLYLIVSNPCFSQASPSLASALHKSTALTGRTTITGRITTSAGAPVVAAVVIAKTGLTNHISTLSAVNRDGTFYMSGIPTASGYKIAVESIHPDFDGRIDTHVDCFQTPASFTDGWYRGSGVTITGSEASATTVDLSTSANQIVDLGQIVLID
jgi:hypothetical protein